MIDAYTIAAMEMEPSSTPTAAISGKEYDAAVTQAEAGFIRMVFVAWLLSLNDPPVVSDEYIQEVIDQSPPSTMMYFFALGRARFTPQITQQLHAIDKAVKQRAFDQRPKVVQRQMRPVLIRPR